MEGEVDSKELRVQQAISAWRRPVDGIGLIITLALVALGAYLAFPALSGDAASNGFIPLFALLGCSLLVADLVDFGPNQRSRIGTMSGMVGPALIVAGLFHAIESHHQNSQFAGIGWMVSGVILMASNTIIFGQEERTEVIRYRAMTRLLGLGIAAAWCIAEIPEGEIAVYLIALLFASFVFGLDLRLGKDDRTQRRVFKDRYETLELRLLEVRASGTIIDQAISLLSKANEVGWTNHDEGMHLIRQAEDDLERILSFSEDITVIEEDAATFVKEAEDIAPLAERPMKALEQGRREVELGSLREGEMLYRRAKNRAQDIIANWANAEKAIHEAKKSMEGLTGTDLDRMNALLQAAQDAMDAEEPGDALTIALAIPAHVSNLGEAMEAASEAVQEAKDLILRTDGLDITLWEEMLNRAEEALEAGDGSLARGLADSIRREIEATEEAKASVQRSLRQRKTLRKRWVGWSDEGNWEARLGQILDDTKKGSWRAAAESMDELTTELDARTAAIEDATELLEFLLDEWKDLRNRLQKTGIGPDDTERLECEGAVASAKEAYEVADVPRCLDALGEADGRMEKLRRRV